MANFRDYNPDQAYLLPPSVKDVLGPEHLCFFIHESVERLDLSEFEQAYGNEGRPGYHPALMLKVWLYGYALGLTSSRRLEQRVREDLAFRYLAGGATPDYWALNEFRKRQGRAINDVFTQVVELARDAGLGRLGHVAIDSTRIAGNAARGRVDSEKRLRRERARIRRQIRQWQKQCAAENPDENPGTRLSEEQVEQYRKRLEGIPKRLERLRKSGQRQLSQTDPDARFLRERGGRFTLGYTAEIAVSEDHLIVAQRVTQKASDNDSLPEMVEAVEQSCRETPEKVSGDSCYFSIASIEKAEQRGVDAYVPDPNLGYELRGGGRAKGIGACRVRSGTIRGMRAKLRTPAGREVYGKRKTIVEPVFGVLKEQRGMRRFKHRGLMAVAVEFTLAATAFNLTRLHSFFSGC
jgi:transposase